MNTMESILKYLALQFAGQSIHSHFETDLKRFDKYSISASQLFFDYSKQNLNVEVISTLVAWAGECQLSEQTNSMYSGVKINNTEKRAVLHTVLRAPANIQKQVLGEKLADEVAQTDARMIELVTALHAGELTGFTGKAFSDVIAIGIGGSYYGPKVCDEALKPYQQASVRVHYLANVDGITVTNKLQGLDPETTLVVVVSKTFVTQETMLNALAVKQWLLESGCSEGDLLGHFIAVTAASGIAEDFGIAKRNILPMWDWVGGRFSLWSAVGFPLACDIGMENFKLLREGAYEMDCHFVDAPFSENIPVLLALIGIWNRSFLGYESLAVLPYDHSLRYLPGYLQQLDMESNGKRVDINGEVLKLAAAPIVFGQEGTNGQHAFMQMMHQSHTTIPTEFLVPMQGHSKYTEHHKVLVANCFAQSEALMQGKTLQQAFQELIDGGMADDEAKALAPHKVMSGNVPSSTITFDKLTPKVMGSLMALYEHKIFVQGVLWNLNSFDQWGVELGKQLGSAVLSVFEGGDDSKLSASSQGLIKRFMDSE